MLVQHCSVGALDLLFGLGGDNGGSVVEVSQSNTAQVDECHEGGSVTCGNVCVGLEDAVGLSSLDGGRVQAAAVDGASLHVVVSLGGILTVVVQPGDGLHADVLSIPVGLVSLEHDGVLSGSVGNNVGTAVSDVVGGLAVGVVLVVSGEVCTELAALGLVVGTAHGSEHAVAQHGHEVGSGLAQSVLQGSIVDSLDADFCEIGDITGDVLGSVNDNALNQVFQTAHGVHHVLHTGDEVVSLDVSDLTALGVDPHSTLADLEGVSLSAVSIVGDGVAFSQSGLQLVFHVVLVQAVVGVNDSFGVSSHGGSQNVPSLGIGIVSQGVGVLQGVALAGQEVLCPLLVGAGALQLVPLALHLIAVSNGQGLGGDDHVVITVGVVAPQSGSSGVGSDAGDSVVTAVGRQGQHNAGSHQLSFSNSHQSLTLGDIGSSLSGFVGGVELAQNVVIDGLRQGIVIVSVLSVGIYVLNGTGGLSCCGFGSSGLSCSRLGCRLVALASDQAECHNESKKHANDLLGIHFQILLIK